MEKVAVLAITKNGVKIGLKLKELFKSWQIYAPTKFSNNDNNVEWYSDSTTSKIVNLLKVAAPQKLLQAYCGMQVGVTVKNRKITIVDKEGSYLGVLPDDVCHHLMRLLKGGNKYEFFIKSVRVNNLSLLIRETFRSKRFKNQPSSGNDYQYR